MALDGLYVRPTEHGYRGVPRWREPYTTEWSIVVGNRIRRLRRACGLSLNDLGLRLPHPGGERYSGSTLSRLERGRASSPFFVYVAIASALGVDAGRLLGPDDAASSYTQAEALVIRTMRQLDLPPEVALARLLGISAPDKQG